MNIFFCYMLYNIHKSMAIYNILVGLFTLLLLIPRGAIFCQHIQVTKPGPSRSYGVVTVDQIFFMNHRTLIKVKDNKSRMFPTLLEKEKCYEYVYCRRV